MIEEGDGYVQYCCIDIYVFRQNQISFVRNDPDLPFGFWFLGPKDHRLQKRRLGLVNSLVFKDSEERDALKNG